MRTEQEVLAQLIDFANKDDRIRAVVLNGSRVNPNAPRDFMMDYDVVFYMTDIKDINYRTDRSWIAQLGELVILQHNDFDDDSFIVMMQFKDSVRIDLNFRNISNIHESLDDSLSVIILNKDNIDIKFPAPNESTYFIEKPSQKSWGSNLNELWWIQVYIAKALWRGEIPRVKYLYDVILMDSLRMLLEWHIGYQHDWQVNAGISGKWFNRFLDNGLYSEYISLYCDANVNEQWDRLLKTGSFIRKVGMPLAEKLGFDYPLQDDINVTEYIGRIRRLPKGAQSFDD